MMANLLFFMITALGIKQLLELFYMSQTNKKRLPKACLPFFIATRSN